MLVQDDEVKPEIKEPPTDAVEDMPESEDVVEEVKDDDDDDDSIDEDDENEDA